MIKKRVSSLQDQIDRIETLVYRLESEDRAFFSEHVGNNDPARLAAIQDFTNRKKAEDESRIQTEQLQTITDAMTTFLETSDWELAITRLLKGAITQTRSEYGFAGIIVNGKSLRILAHQEPLMDQKAAFFEFADLNNIFGEVIKTGKAVLSNDLATDLETLLPGHPPLRNLLGVPILKAEDSQGFIAVANRAGGYHTTLQARLEILARTASVLYDSYRRSEKEEALRTRLHQLERIDALGRLAAGIAHDFNNTLMVISGYSEILLSKFAFSDEFCRDVLEIQKAADRGSSLTSQLLSFSRKQPLELRFLDLNEIIRSMHEMLQRTMGEDVDVSLELDPNLSIVRADCSQMEQVIMNLAVNARDAMPQGGRLVARTSNVSVGESSEKIHPELLPGHYAMLTFQDTGCGMDEATRALIFEPFFTTKAAGKGLGIGLATVFSIIEQTHGYIFAESQTGKGTVFQIYLPQAQEAHESTSSSTEEDPTLSASTGETILLVDDSDSVRVPIATVLAAQGYNVLESRNAAEALALLQNHKKPIQLMVTDVIMPGLSGYELAQQARRYRHDLKVIYISGYSQEYLSMRPDVDSSSPFISKPTTMEALLCRVREVLDAASMLNQSSQ